MTVDSHFNPHMLRVFFGDVCVEGDKTTPRGSSASRLTRNKIPMATLMFSR